MARGERRDASTIDARAMCRCSTGLLAIAGQNRSGGMAVEPGAFRRLASTVDAGSRRRAVATLLYDPQTSGGLLVAVAEARGRRVEAALRGRRCAASRIGRVRRRRWRYPRPRGINRCLVAMPRIGLNRLHTSCL